MATKTQEPELDELVEAARRTGELADPPPHARRRDDLFGALSRVRSARRLVERNTRGRP